MHGKVRFFDILVLQNINSKSCFTFKCLAINIAVTVFLQLAYLFA